MLHTNIYLKLLLAALLVGLTAGCSDKGGNNITDLASPIPSIQSVSPDKGTVGTELTISGSNFEPSTITIVGGIDANDIEYSSSTTLYIRVPSGVEGNIPLDINMENSDGQQATHEESFTTIDPQLMFVNSATKPSGNIGSTVILEGRAF